MKGELSHSESQPVVAPLTRAAIFLVTVWAATFVPPLDVLETLVSS